MQNNPLVLSKNTNSCRYNEQGAYFNSCVTGKSFLLVLVFDDDEGSPKLIERQSSHRGHFGTKVLGICDLRCPRFEEMCSLERSNDSAMQWTFDKK